MPAESANARAGSVLLASLKLGCTSFGGPIAHLGYFERSYVEQRRWLPAADYASIVALCQLLPGPTSSQVGFLVGFKRAGWRGALAAWIGFTLPSVLLMVAFAMVAPHVAGRAADAALHGLKLVAVAVVAQAVLNMARRLCPDLPRAAIALCAAAALIVAPGTSLQGAVLASGGLAGYLLYRNRQCDPPRLSFQVGATAAWAAGGIFVVLSLGLSLAALYVPHGVIGFSAIVYRAGALVFGGGHVVLPLLRDSLVPAGFFSDGTFLAGYGAAQALPGPLFSIAAYLGAVSAPQGTAPLWAAAGVACIFLPGLLLAVAGAAVWSRGTQAAGARAAVAGINAGAVGILGAALYDPVWIAAIHSKVDIAAALGGLILLERWRVPPLVVLVVCIAVAEVAA